ncbi:type II toxin-antitoxin system Phd/YefM family antitoxin [Cupriavidus sp. SW-Y-13]
MTRWGAPNAVVMSEEQYTSWAETIYLLNSPANAEHLARSLEQLRKGEVE